MNNKPIFKIGLVSAGNIGNAILGFVFLAVVAKYLSLNDFGKYALLTSVLLLFTKIIDFGSNSIFVTKSLTENRADKIINSFHTLKLLMLALSVPVGVLILYLLGFRQILLFFIFVMGMFAYTINLIFYAHFQKYENFLCLVLLNTLPAIIKGSAAGLIILRVVNVDLLTAFSIFALSMFSDIFLYFFLPINARVFKPDLSYVKEIFSNGIPSGVSQLVQESWAAINNTIAKILYGFNDVGIFSMANKISNIFSLISLSVFAVLLPKNAKRKNDKKQYDINETVILSALVLILGLLAISVSKSLLQIIFDGKFNDSINILYILIFSSSVSAVSSFTENYFLVENKTKYILAINLTKISVFFISALILIPIYGIYGLAFSNLISAIVSIITTIVFITKLSG